MSTTTEIMRIMNAKTDIANVLRDKGVTVPSTTKIDGYAALVRKIPKIIDVTLTEGAPQEVTA